MTAVPVGLFGTGRSGTTLLTRLLDGMPEGYVHPAEITFLSALDELASRRRVSRSTQANVTVRPLGDLSRPVPSGRLLGFYGHQMREIESGYLANVADPPSPGPSPEAAIAARDAWQAAAFVPGFLNAMAAWLTPAVRPRFLVFKTIETPYVADYHALFPAMRFVHLMRHPVDFWASAKRTLLRKNLPAWYFASDTLRAMIEYRWVAHAEAVLRRRDDPRHRLLRFEDLVAGPEGHVADLCGWLGTPPPPQPRRQTTLGGRDFATMPDNPSEAGVETPREVRDTTRDPLSRSAVVTGRERDFILLRTRPYLAALGYDEEIPVADEESVRRAWRRPDAFETAGMRGPVGLLRGAHSMLLRRRYVRDALAAAARTNRETAP
ncbi:MAG: sulfotransferase [Acetobacterales bacterium]